MSTIADIRRVWDSEIFDHVTMRGYTTSVYPYDIPNLESAKNSTQFYFAAEINFMTFVVSRIRRDGLTGQIRYEFPVRVRYYRENEPSGDNFKSITDRLEAMDSLVRSELGNTWGSTVDYYEPNERGISAPDLVFLENRPTWVSEVTYTGIQTVSA